MLQYCTQDSIDAHYAATDNGIDRVLVQVQNEHGDQARVKLSTDNARHLILLLNEAIKAIENRKQ